VEICLYEVGLLSRKHQNDRSDKDWRSTTIGDYCAITEVTGRSHWRTIW